MWGCIRGITLTKGACFSWINVLDSRGGLYVGGIRAVVTLEEDVLCCVGPMLLLARVVDVLLLDAGFSRVDETKEERREIKQDM